MKLVDCDGAGLSDAALMLRARDDDEAAFGILYERYHRKVLDFFYGMSRNASLAEDLCHETFLRIWKLRKRYAATGSFPAYLFTFARHVWLESSRRDRRIWRLGVRQPMEEDWQAPAAGNGGVPDVRAARSELEARIVDALEGLPDEQRMVFVMRNIEGLSLDEIASALQCPVNTVRSRRILAIKKLREALHSVFVSYMGAACAGKHGK